MDAAPDDGPTGCRDNTDCGADEMGNRVCDTATGRCVACTASNRGSCTAGQYCTPANRCEAGCATDMDCAAADAGVDHCNVATHTCVTCARDADCAAGFLCATNGNCVPGCNVGHPCATGQACCAGACVDTLSNPAACGTCTTMCAGATNATPACAAGSCGIACNAGFADCDGNAANGCEANTATNPMHCGACGTACRAGPGATASCAMARCASACDPGFLDCDMDPSNGCEVNGTTNPASCGACGAACPARANAAGTCAGGRCGIACQPGFADCDGDAANGCEVALDAVGSCGACGRACSGATPVCGTSPTGNVCVSGCAAAQTRCGMSCVDTQSDVTDCGACGNACPARANARPTCAAGRCGHTCDAGFGDCDGDATNGCETATRESAAHCGTCGRACATGPNATATCTAGECGLTCAAGFGNCDGDASNGCETNLATDASGCGACGTVCGPGRSCIARMCVSSVPATCAEVRRRAPTTPSGVQSLDPDGLGGAAPQLFYCDMALDDGGWTLIGRGVWYNGFADDLPTGANALLTDATRARVLAATGRTFRLGSGARRLFIEDMNPNFGPGPVGRHFWRTAAASVRCATEYARVLAGTMASTGSHAVNCDGQGIGSHTCGHGNGWILWHTSDTYNYSGAHPCAFGTGDGPTGYTLTDLWVR